MTDFLKKNSNKRYSRYTFLEAVFAERFVRTIRDLPKRAVLQKGYGIWIDILPKLTKQYNIRIHSSNNMTPIQLSLKKEERDVYRSLQDKRNKINSKFQLTELFRLVDLM